MQLLDRNKRTISYKTYSGTATESTGSDGYYTGERAVVYSALKTVKAYITANRGDATEEMFGKTLDYDNIMFVGLDSDINEYSILWVDAIPTPISTVNPDTNVPNDYVVVRVATSLNHKAIAIKKVR